jgi:hypothetical protein
LRLHAVQTLLLLLLPGWGWRLCCCELALPSWGWPMEKERRHAWG